MTIKKIGIIGAGTMGHGIALVAAKAGYDVILHDVKDEYVKKGINSIEKFINKSVEKGKMTPEDKNNILEKIHGTTKLEDMKDTDLIIEAIVEEVKIKKDLFQRINHFDKIVTLKIVDIFTINEVYIILFCSYSYYTIEDPAFG